MNAENPIQFVERHGCTLGLFRGKWRCWFDEIHYVGPFPTKLLAAKEMMRIIKDSQKEPKP